MKLKIRLMILALSLLVSGRTALADETNGIAADMKDLITRINTKLKEDKRTEADLAAEIKEFDTLLAKHKGEDAEELAHVASMKAGLYLQVLDQPEKATELFKQIKLDYPKTKAAEQTEQILASIAQQAEMKKIQDALAVGSKFPDFDEKDIEGKALSIASRKGKIVLLDFWATWCGPCRAELPNVLAVYAKHHAEGFEIIGISLDDDRTRLDSFIKDKQMTWPQYFDGLKWKNKIASKYGVNSIPATYLLDGEGKILGKDLRGEELEKTVAEAIAKK